MNLKAVIPWWAKIGAKLVLSRMPARYRFWQRMNLFLHGQMDRPDYALRVVREHLGRAGLKSLQGCTVLELGPGDSLATVMIAKALGADRTILVDVGPFAKNNLAPYEALRRYLEEQGLRAPSLAGCAGVDDMLVRCDATYVTSGVTGMRIIPDGSVDFSFSHAVLEHVRSAHVFDILRELYRCMKVTGVSSHTIDLKDHLGGALNNLRFRRELWEADWMASSGFYTNRLRFTEFCGLFEDAGFHVNTLREDRFSKLPTPRKKMQQRFRSLPEEDLLISGFDVLLRKDNYRGLAAADKSENPPNNVIRQQER